MNEIDTVSLEYMLIHEDAILPSKKRQEDAGYDIYTIETKIIPARSILSFSTGIRAACPLGWFMSIRGRSSLGFKGIKPFIGTLDAGYNGELKVLLENFGDEPYQVNKGDRIAQLILERQTEVKFVEIEEFSPEYNKRGTDGFGSSGK
tara:strand:- start:53484 stop:53927 length:444 start_codon:yes stop_codon:yes gene_type:complete